tara:strand:- start:282 stop:446 length:165 start_codon:yes stop_codon:yes gene_type:complete
MWKPLCSVNSALSVCGYVASNPVAQFLGSNVGQKNNHFLVVIKVVSEFLTVIFN